MACLDTTVLIDLSGRGIRGASRRAKETIIALVGDGESLVTTRFNVAELYVGVERSDEPRRELAKVARILSDLAILEFDDRAARVFGFLMGHTRRIGRPVGDMDALIAAVSIANGQSLVTRNPKHFVSLPGLEIHAY